MNTLFSSRVAENANSRRRTRLIFDTPAHVPVPSNNDNNNNNNSSASVEGAGAESKPGFQRLASWMQNREDPFGADVPTPIPPLKLPSSSAGSRSSVTISNSNSNAESSDIILAPRMKRQNAQGEGSPCVSVFPPGMERQNAHSGEESGEDVLPPRLERQFSHSSRHSCVREVSSSGVGSTEGTETGREEDTVDSDWSQLRVSSFDNCTSQIEKPAGINECKGSDICALPPQTHFPKIASSKSMSAGLMPMPAVLLAGTNAVPMLSTLANGVLVNQVPFGRSADGRSVTVAVALPRNRDGLSRRKEGRRLRRGGSTGRKQWSRGLSEVDIPLTPFNPFGDAVDDTELRQSQPAGEEQSRELLSESLRTHESKTFSSRAGIFGGGLGEDSVDGNDADDERLDALSDVDNLSEDEDILVTESAIDEMEASKSPNHATTTSSDVIREDYFNGGDNALAATGAAFHSLQSPLIRLPRSTSAGGKPAPHHSCTDLQLPHAPTSTPLALPISRPLPPNRSLSEHNRTRQGLCVVPSIVVSSSPHRESAFTLSTDALAGNENVTNPNLGEDVEGGEERKKVYLGGAAKQVRTAQAPSVASQCATPIQMHDGIEQIQRAESLRPQNEIENATGDENAKGNGNGTEIEEVRRSAFLSRENLVDARKSSSPQSLPSSQTQMRNSPSSNQLTRSRVDEEGNGINGSGRLTRSKTFGRNVMGKIRRLGHLKKRATD